MPKGLLSGELRAEHIGETGDEFAVGADIEDYHAAGEIEVRVACPAYINAVIGGVV